jgi:hypothetical protein
MEFGDIYGAVDRLHTGKPRALNKYHTRQIGSRCCDLAERLRLSIRWYGHGARPKDDQL